jgi:hypothetical protein
LLIVALAVFCTVRGTSAEAPPQDLPTGAPTPPATSEPSGNAALAEAPFGLRWMASKQDVTDMGVIFKSPMDTDFGTSYVVSQLPKELPDLHYAVLSFGDDDQLIRIIAIGTGFDRDDDGSRIKARYKELDDLLQKKYGAGKLEQHTEKNCEGDNFMRCLGAKRSWMYTKYSPPDMRVELSAFVESGQTRWRIIFEYTPGMEHLERQRKQVEERAL